MLSLVTKAQGTPAAKARLSMVRAISGLVAKSTSCGMPACRQRSRSSAQHPAPGQVERAVDESLTMAAGVGQEHADLAVLDAPGRARILTMHAGRLRALLQKPGLVKHQDGLLIAQVLDDVGAQIVAYEIGIPAHAGEEVLHAVGGTVAGRFGQLPAVLALDRGQQPTQVSHGPLARLAPGKARRKPAGERLELSRPPADIGLGRHRQHLRGRSITLTPAVVLDVWL